MKSKYLSSVILALTIFGIIFISGCIQQKSEPQPVKLQYKGIWLPTLLLQDSNHLSNNIQKLKDIGINTIFIQGSSPQHEQWLERDKELFPPELIGRIREILPFEKEIIIDNIETAHRNGLKVGLTLAKPIPAPKLEEIDLEVWNSKIIEYAKLAEEYDVELFAPLNEPDEIFLENTGKWRQEILPRIREVYHGEIIWKGGMFGLPDKTLTEGYLKEISEGPPRDFSGYDYIGFTLFVPEGQTLEEFSQRVDNILKYVPALAERDNCKGIMISEFVVLEGGPRTEEEIVKAHEIVLEKGKDKVVGFIVSDFLEVELPGVPIMEEVLSKEEVIRRYFTEIL